MPLRPPSVLLIRPSEPSHELQFSIGMGYIARALSEAGFAVETLCLDLFDIEDIGVLRFLVDHPHKIFGIGGMYGSFHEFIRLCRLIRTAVPDAVILLGGALPTSCPEFMLAKTGADIACIGPAEESTVKVVEALVGGGDVRRQLELPADDN